MTVLGTTGTVNPNGGLTVDAKGRVFYSSETAVYELKTSGKTVTRVAVIYNHIPDLCWPWLLTLNVLTYCNVGVSTLIAGQEGISGYADGVGTSVKFGSIRYLAATVDEMEKPTLFATDYGSRVLRQIRYV